MRVSRRARLAAFLAADLAIVVAMVETVLQHPREASHDFLDVVLDLLGVK